MLENFLISPIEKKKTNNYFFFSHDIKKIFSFSFFFRFKFKNNIGNYNTLEINIIKVSQRLC